MNPQRPFAHVPRRLLNLVVIAVGLPCVLILNALNWSAVASFALTAALVLISVLIVAAIYPRRSE
ncbi:MAG: hypothetical protein CUN49_09830 [Candidatus Thermofonsia Clade 1 bacterium]|uniref:Uncharacterized protein n=1 Tax=Candidatus Thermofonsia Clade 1 bacterium TaxID=2364210 RepID=A0A2M8PDH6_9CHLR|nr:MAG: hypothetical protein CUN49_09830 [Candidatus Thermofonsia Clade 1 bacterium]RMF52411.1 MAG: hypothetical protein D6749_04990 [Chloroflexota bacterium]